MASNITLKIDARDEGAVRAFLELGEAERNLEVKIRKGNVALKEREQRERAVAAGTRKTAAETRAAGKDAEHAGTRMFNMGRDTARAIQAFAGFGASVGILRAVQQELAGIDNALVASAKSANIQQKGLREFVALQAEGPEGTKFVGETLIAGAQRGLTPEQTGAIAQPIQSIVDVNGDGRLDTGEKAAFATDFGAAAGMSEAGVASEDALKIVTAGRARGQSGQESADLMAAAAALSALGPSDVAKSISATSEFSDQKQALSILTGLSKEQTETKKLPAAMERLGIILGKSGEVGETAGFSKKYGLEGLTETQKIEALRQYGLQHGEGDTAAARVRSFTATLPGEKGLAKETALDLARVIRQTDTVTSARGALDEGSAGALDAILKKNIESPLSGPGIVADRQAALAAVGQLIGPQSQEAQARLSRRQIAGARMVQEGDVLNVTPGGESKAISEQSWSAWAKRGLESMGRSASVGYGAGPGLMEIERQQAVAQAAPQANMEGVMSVQRELVEQLKRNNELLSENNSVTAQNSAASRGRAPVGGSAGNAEEKH